MPTKLFSAFWQTYFCVCETPAEPVNWPVGDPSATTLPCIKTPPKPGLSAPPVNVSTQNWIRGSVFFDKYHNNVEIF